MIFHWNLFVLGLTLYFEENITLHLEIELREFYNELTNFN